VVPNPSVLVFGRGFGDVVVLDAVVQHLIQFPGERAILCVEPVF
jgi:hypothetical protein